MQSAIQFDIFLVRNILFFLGTAPEYKKRDRIFDPYPNEVLRFHIQLLKEAGFIELGEVSSSDEINWSEISLNDRGYEFLYMIRNEAVWSRLVDTNLEGLSLSDVNAIAAEINSKSADKIAQGRREEAYSNNRSPKFGHKIKNTRISKGWARRELAEKAGVKVSLIDWIENGVDTDIEEISRLSEALEIPFESLVSGTEYASFRDPKLDEKDSTKNRLSNVGILETVVALSGLAESDTPDSSANEQQTQSQPQPSEQQTEEESRIVQIGTVGDQPTADDKLGFTPYVEAIAKFLMDPKTRGPLTLSIEGEWGSGKSSFMLQVEEELKKIDGNILTVHFNAWRYDKEDALWAAFATKVAKELSQKVSWQKRLEANWELFRTRFDWKKGWFSFLSLGLVALSLFYLAILLVNNYLINPSSFAPMGGWLAQVLSKDGADFVIRFLTLTVAGYLILYVFALRKIKEFLLNPLTTDFKKHLRAPDYKQRATFLDEFHEDFSKIIEAYAGKEDKAQRVFVFIDDLDRCDVPKSAELMQALNLMLSENPQLYFIIGMDREKVAAGIAVKHEKLLEYLAPPSPTEKPNANPKLEYGFEFIEKFIQVPFKVPQARPDDIETLIAELGGRKKQAAETPTELAEKPPEPDNPDLLRTVIKKTPVWGDVSVFRGGIYGENPVELEETKPPKQEDADSPEIDKIIKIVGPFFDYNPRRLKQFLNIYRLKIYIGNKTGLFNHPAVDSKFKRINLHKLGKFVAIDLRYPMLIAEMDDNPLLLEELQKAAFKEIPFEEVSSDYWASKLRLTKLLKAPVDGDEKSPDFYDQYGLIGIDTRLLLQISPSTKTLQTSAPENSPSAEESVQ